MSLKDYSGKLLWENETPNSPFGVRPVSLICQKENEKNVKFILDTIINPEVSLIEKDGISLPNGQVIVQIMRTTLDGKMSAILSGAGGASCQLCTTHFNGLKDLDLIRAGYPINRSIKDAKLIFETVDREEFLSLPSNERFGLTHEPISSIDIVSASPPTLIHLCIPMVHAVDLPFTIWNSQMGSNIQTYSRFNEICT